MVGQNSLEGAAPCQLTEDHAHRQAQITDARQAAHLRWVHSDSLACQAAILLCRRNDPAADRACGWGLVERHARRGAGVQGLVA